MRTLLKRFCSASSPSGYEGKIQQEIRNYLLDRGVSCEFDVLGNVIFRKQGVGRKTLMLIAHCDEIGLSVKYIDDNGFVYFTPIGGVDVSLLRGQCMSILHGDTVVYGVVGAKPRHLTKRGRVEEIDFGDLWIDIGSSDKQQTEQIVSVGDSITFSPNYMELKNGLFTSKSIDNRSGIVALMLIYDRIKDIVVNNDVVFVASVQEEIGLRGAVVAGYSISPDVCIAIDVTHATDCPTMDLRKNGNVKLGSGGVIPLGANFNYQLQNELKDIAGRKKIKYQVEASPSFSGTDIAAVQLARRGCKTGLVSIPCRYMHSPLEVASYEDVESVVDIISSYCIEK